MQMGPCHAKQVGDRAAGIYYRALVGPPDLDRRGEEVVQQAKALPFAAGWPGVWNHSSLCRYETLLPRRRFCSYTAERMQTARVGARNSTPRSLVEETPVARISRKSPFLRTLWTPGGMPV
jgi:hypothetical protein